MSVTLDSALISLTREDCSEPSQQKYFRQLLVKCLMLLNKAVEDIDRRAISRVLRMAVAIRRIFDIEEFICCIFFILTRTRLINLKYAIRAILHHAISEKTAATSDECIGPRFKAILQFAKLYEFSYAEVILPDLTHAPKIAEMAKEIITSLGYTDGLKDMTTLKSKLAKLFKTMEGPFNVCPGAIPTYENICISKDLDNVHILLSTMVLMKIIDDGCAAHGTKLASFMLKIFAGVVIPRRFNDALIAKGVFYSCRIFELTGQYYEPSKLLMKIYRAASIHHYTLTQVVALNMLLKSFIQTSQYEQATKLLEKAMFPFDSASHAQAARYFYYLARIAAVRLDYGLAHTQVTQALRKAPASGTKQGRGFRLAATKLLIISQLLLGEIPERRLFAQSDMSNALSSYCQIVQAVRSGDLVSFKGVMEKNKELFTEDGNYVLVQRLHKNVIKAGLRKIAASYSRISFTDVASKLGLDSTDDPESIISKAIADGVIDVIIDYKSQTILKKSQNLHPWHEICGIFSRKIELCLQLQNEAIKAMKYTVSSEKMAIEEAERRRELQEQLARVLYR